ncbi:P-loop NTPase fold protein, partial [[Eubacterium] hominis]
CIVSYLELILLSVSSSLDLPEFLVLISMIIFLDDLSYYKKESIKKKKTNEILKESDFPNPELIYKRQVQLKKFKQILKDQIKEPYAVMINAKWGMGKTSFVMALEKELTNKEEVTNNEEKTSNDIFIWIEVGSEKSVDQIMRTLSVKIIQILKENNVFIENEALVEKYFFSYLKESKLKVLNQFIINYVLKSDESDKEYINNKLGELNRTIYLIIDDLDRCKDEDQDKIFKVLR